MIVWVKTALDFLVTAMNYFPGWKTKVGAVITVIGTLALVYNQYLGALVGFEIPPEIPPALLVAGQTLTAVGAANQPTNTK